MSWIAKYWVEWVFGLVAAGVITALKILAGRVKRAQQKNDALEDGMRALLRDRITQAHDEYVQRGFCPAHARDNIDNMYEAYHSLGGNGTVTAMMDELRRLPIGDKNMI